MSVSPRERVLTALSHTRPDRTPVDLLAVPEVWEKLQTQFAVSSREEVLQKLEVDLRRISYDSYYFPPEEVTGRGEVIWEGHPAVTTTERVWRLRQGDIWLDLWGARRKQAAYGLGWYENLAEYPLAQAGLDDLRAYRWPTPDWFDFSSMETEIKRYRQEKPYHIRYRIGSLFETAWSLRGFEQTLMDLVLEPELPGYIMDRILEVHLANLDAVMARYGNEIDMVYIYDDLATQDGLLMRPAVWRKIIRPRQARLIEAAQRFGKPVMYHCDGSIYSLLPEFLDMGVTLLNPIQTDAAHMDAESLKAEFGQRLNFHGGVDIVNLLPKGSTEEVSTEVKRLIRTLGYDGGYILAPAHHLQADTPVENILAMYDVALR